MAAFIEDKLLDALARDNELSVVLVKCKAESQLKEIDQCIHETLRRKDDASIIIKSEKMIIVAAEIEQGSERALRQRLEKSINEKFEDTIVEDVLGVEESVVRWISELKKQMAPLVSAAPVKRILIIDDEEELLENVAAVLESTQINVRINVVNNGYDACLHIGEYKPDLVILDMMMPEFDGEQVLKLIKNSARWDAIKVLVISGDRLRCLEMMEHGADDYLSKSFNLNDLIEKTAQLLGNDKIGQLRGSTASAEVD